MKDKEREDKGNDELSDPAGKSGSPQSEGGTIPPVEPTDPGANPGPPEPEPEPE